MPELAHNGILITALECAEHTGITIRALRLYEQHGLIAPRRTSKQWRLYGRNEITRLNEIIALKALGLSLRDIAKLLRNYPTNLTQTLTLQRDALEETRKRAEHGLLVIDALHQKIGSGVAVSIDDLTHLARETNMTESSQNTPAWRRYEQMRPRTEVAIDPALPASYVGAYATDDGVTFIASERNGRLFYRVVGQADTEIVPESDNQFFMKGLPVQVSFHRDGSGEVRSLIHYQNGSEAPAERMNLDQALQIEREVKRRIEDQRPMPDSELILRRVIADHARGEPDIAGMSPSLAVLAGEQRDFIKAELERAGPAKALSFKGVAQGLDIYDVEFENAKMEWGFARTFKGKISHLYLRPTF
ncbi:MAG: MerR family transcriptional regulator [Rhizobium sp.]|nr:MAG: MerR family transcriptional regulator [Rhizobium sp.]